MIAEYADLYGILMAPHGTVTGYSLAALVRCAQRCRTTTSPSVSIGNPTWWYDIVEGARPDCH